MNNLRQKIKMIADMHTHTISSTHAYSTIFENIKVAKERGLKFIAITDHSEKSIGGPGEWYFENLREIPKEVEGVKVLTGIECNILNSTGELDYPIGMGKPLDWVVASIHRNYFNSPIATTTETWLNIAENPKVNVIAHSGSEDYKYDYEKVIPAFGEKHKLVEINNSSFSIRKSSIKNCAEIARICKKYSVPVIVNTDAHFCTKIGNFDNALKMLEEVDFPAELIINSNYENMNNYIKEYSNYYKE